MAKFWTIDNKDAAVDENTFCPWSDFLEAEEKRCMVDELKSFDATVLRDMDTLIQQLSASSRCTAEQLTSVMADRNAHVYVIRVDNRIVATATLCICHTPEFTLGGVEAVVTHCDYRGRGYGRMLMQHILHEAKMLGCIKLHLTSNPKRVEANLLYQRLGFKKYETNCYVLDVV